MENPATGAKKHKPGKRTQLEWDKIPNLEERAELSNVMYYSRTRLYYHLGTVKVYRLFGVTKQELDLMFCIYGYVLQVGCRTVTQDQLLRTITRSVWTKKRLTGAWLGLIRKKLLERVITVTDKETYCWTYLGLEVVRIFLDEVKARVSKPYQQRAHYKAFNFEELPIESIESLMGDNYNRYKVLPDRVESA